jgi:hypothetical protein
MVAIDDPPWGQIVEVFNNIVGGGAQDVKNLELVLDKAVDEVVGVRGGGRRLSRQSLQARGLARIG